MNLTEIVVVLDRSGSMHSIREDIIGGFNTFLKEQKEVPGKARLTLVQFDHEYKVVYSGVDIQNVEPLTEKSFIPRGSTALYDAVGLTMSQTGERLSQLEKSKRPEKVLFVIITDGYENSSSEWAGSKISEMIDHQRSKYNWEFMFFGANQDAFKVAKNLNIPLGNSMTYHTSGQGVADMSKTFSQAVTTYRTSTGLTDNLVDSDSKKSKKWN